MALLTSELLAAAHLLNAYFAKRLGWPVPFGASCIGDDTQALRIAQMQAESGHLLIDGVLGPKTRAHLRGERWAPPACGQLVIAGQVHTTPFAAISFAAPAGLSFAEQAGWQMRSRPDGGGVDLIVLHWDECISSTHCFAVLLQRQLSVHLMLDADGTVYQALDLAEARAWHARTHNERSVGIEIQNALLPKAGVPQDARRGWVEETLPHTERTFGHLDFTPEQKACVQKLVPWLCQKLGVPARLPQTADGHVPNNLCAQPFDGVCGHYHLQTDKVDPGAMLWPLIEEAWGRTATQV
jgi:N-acetyl-anhydromuramyl-L-alanine amidase AmpD